MLKSVAGGAALALALLTQVAAAGAGTMSLATTAAEPLVTVTRYVCLKRKRGANCTSEDFSGTVRRSEMTVDPFLRRATIRGVLGGCALDIEFAGIGLARPGGNLSAWHGQNGGPQIGLSGSETFTSDAHWWGGVCGRTVIVDGGQGSASVFRGAEVSVSGFGSEGGCDDCCECGE